MQVHSQESPLYETGAKIRNLPVNVRSRVEVIVTRLRVTCSRCNFYCVFRNGQPRLRPIHTLTKPSFTKSALRPVWGLIWMNRNEPVSLATPRLERCVSMAQIGFLGPVRSIKLREVRLSLLHEQIRAKILRLDRSSLSLILILGLDIDQLGSGTSHFRGSRQMGDK